MYEDYKFSKHDEAQVRCFYVPNWTFHRFVKLNSQGDAHLTS